MLSSFHDNSRSLINALGTRSQRINLACDPSEALASSASLTAKPRGSVARGAVAVLGLFTAFALLSHIGTGTAGVWGGCASTLDSRVVAPMTKHLAASTNAPVPRPQPEPPGTRGLKFFDPIACAPASAVFNFTSDPSARESGRSAASGSISRQRALALAVLRYASSRPGATHVSCLGHIWGAGLAGPLSATSSDGGEGGDESVAGSGSPPFTVWNTESNGAVHAALLAGAALAPAFPPRYIASEYISPSATPGETSGPNGVRHEDLQAPSPLLRRAAVDLIVSAEVLEHVPLPYEAHARLFEALRPGGAHVFTIPFAGTPDDVIMSTLRPDGSIEHGPGAPSLGLVAPQYHGDPLRRDGILVFTIFGHEMERRLRGMGYELEVLLVHAPEYGVFGSHRVYVARRGEQQDA